jgi:hypothetical protein
MASRRTSAASSIKPSSRVLKRSRLEGAAGGLIGGDVDERTETRVH